MVGRMTADGDLDKPLDLQKALDLQDALWAWVVRQRWFAGKSGRPRLRLVGSLEWPPGADVAIRTHLVLDEGSERAVLYQIPVAYRAAPTDAVEAAHIGTVSDEGGRLVHAYDAAHDPAFADRLLELVFTGDRVGDDRVSARGARTPDRTGQPHAAGRPRLVEAHVLSGEQSNTSIICTLDDGRRVICKIFRSLHHGDNPDVVLQSALSAAGSDSVPPVVGSVVGEWPDDGRPTGRAVGHLVFAQEFLAGAEDAWSLALSEAAAGRDFTAVAREMGTVTADVHSVLAEVLPTREATPDDIATIGGVWRERLHTAVREVPELEPLRAPIELLYERAAAGSWPRLQRIHGDLHLGQVLAVAGRGLAIIDFEGEPMQPLSARSGVDVPLRDVAGMLRSFDYVAGASDAAPGILHWTRACRAAFLDGYQARTEHDLARDQLLLDAFELDKALYEAVYEARNRPSWLPIPVDAVRRLAARASAPTGATGAADDGEGQGHGRHAHQDDAERKHLG